MQDTFLKLVLHKNRLHLMTAQIVIKKDLFLLGRARNGITEHDDKLLKIIPFYDPKTPIKMPLFWYEKV